VPKTDSMPDAKPHSLPKHNGPEGPLATETGKRDVSAFPRRLSLLGLLHGVRPPSLVTRGVSIPTLATHDGATSLDGYGDQLLSASLATKIGHLKPPTRGTLTLGVSHV
jgi:hypothetical protein